MTHPLRKTRRNRLMQEMYDDGYSCTAIAEAFNVSRQRVGQLINMDSVNKHYQWRQHHEPKKQRPGVIWRFLNRLTVGDECWTYDGYTHPEGYPRITGTRFLPEKHGGWAHRLSYLIFSGDIPKEGRVMHLCGNKLCVNPSHLTLYRKGSRDRTRGMRPGPEPKLSQEQRERVRETYGQRITMRRLAQMYGVSTTTIFNIIHNR